MSVPATLHGVLSGVDYAQTAIALYVLLAVAVASTFLRPMQGWGPFVRVAAVVSLVATFVADAMVRQYYSAWEFGIIQYTDDGYPIYPELPAIAFILALIAAVFCALITAVFVSLTKAERTWRGVALLGGATGVLAAFGQVAYTLGILMPAFSTIKNVLFDVWMYARDFAAVTGLLFIAVAIWAERRSYGDRRAADSYQKGMEAVYDDWPEPETKSELQAPETVQVAEVPDSQWRPESQPSQA